MHNSVAFVDVQNVGERSDVIADVGFHWFDLKGEGRVLYVLSCEYV